MHDLIIIGGGPAGLTAALYAGRSRLKTLLIEKMSLGGQIILSPAIENFPGFPGAIETSKLILAMQQQIEELGIEVKTDEAIKIAHYSGFKVCARESEYQAKTLIVSSGACSKKLNIPGEEKLMAKGVSYCGTCDGPLFKAKEIVVVGGGDKAVEEAIYLTKFGSKVTLIHRRESLRASKILQERICENKKIEILWNSIPQEILGGNFVEGLKIKNLKDNRIRDMACSAVFIFIGIHPHTEFLKGLVKLDEQGFILTDEDMQTSLDGLFAAGDCRKKTLTQVITACGDGATAAFCANRYLEMKGL